MVYIILYRWTSRDAINQSMQEHVLCVSQGESEWYHKYGVYNSQGKLLN